MNPDTYYCTTWLEALPFATWYRSTTRTAEALISHGQEGQGDGLSGYQMTIGRGGSGAVTINDRLTLKRKDGGPRLV